MFRFRALFASLALAALLVIPTTTVLAAELPPDTRPCGPNNVVCYKTNKPCTIDNDCKDSDSSNLGNAWACSSNVCYLDSAGYAQYNASTTVFGITVQTNDVPLAKPALQIHIPGLNFSDTRQTLDKEGYIHIPYIGEYLGAAYKYALGIGTILAVIMIIKNGVTIILSAGGEGKMESFHQIGQVVIGLMIMWGSFVILNAINPSLTQFKALRIKYVQPVNLEKIDPKVYARVTGKQVVTKSEALKQAVAAGVTAGFSDQCIMKSILAQESGSDPAVVGHDENYPGTVSVFARRNFLLSGLKFSSAVFTAPFTDKKDYKPKIHNSDDNRNDDVLNDTAPDYGLDWRFSHGFGLGQVTLKGTYYCNDQRGITLDGTCYTIPELLTVDKNLEYAAKLYKQYFDCVGSGMNIGGRDQIMAAFMSYNAGCGAVKQLTLDQIRDNGYTKSIMRLYDACIADPNTSAGSLDAIPKVIEEEA